jgi:hypothetical protein
LLWPFLDTTDQGVKVDGPVEAASGAEEITFSVDDRASTAYRAVVGGVFGGVCTLVRQVVPVEGILNAPLGRY